MKKYLLKTTQVGEVEDHIPLNLEGKDRIEPLTHDEQPRIDTFSSAADEYDLRTHFQREWLRLKAPFEQSKNLISFAVMAAISYFLVWTPIPSIVLRGWRLDVVRRIGSNTVPAIPTFYPTDLIGYFIRGLVLIFWRGVYFLPLVILSFKSVWKLFLIAKDTIYFIFEQIFVDSEGGLTQFIAYKVIPQFGIDVLITLVAMALYTVFVWPVYRILMMQYAMKDLGATGFMSPRRVLGAWKIFRRNAAAIYGIYGFALTIDVVSSLVITLIGLFSGGLLLILIPLASLFFRFYVKGYAYGRLADLLVSRTEINVNSTVR